MPFRKKLYAARKHLRITKYILDKWLRYVPRQPLRIHVLLKILSQIYDRYAWADKEHYVVTKGLPLIRPTPPRDFGRI